jgi:hypothetical protein
MFFLYAHYQQLIETINKTYLLIDFIYSIFRKINLHYPRKRAYLCIIKIKKLNIEKNNNLKHYDYD